MPLETALDLPVFQGPLDLLLTLIERRRLTITEVSLAAVADQYLRAVRALPERDPDLLGEFLVIAARLLWLKSRALLPLPDSASGGIDEETIDDLAQRLEDYRRFKQIALELAARFDSGQQAFRHPARPELGEYQPPLEPIEAEMLAQLWRSIGRRQPPRAIEEAPLEPRVQVTDRLNWLRGRLAASATLTWEEVGGRTLDELIATFLAVLELIRRHELRVRQEQPFGPILFEEMSRPSDPQPGPDGP